MAQENQNECHVELQDKIKNNNGHNLCKMDKCVAQFDTTDKTTEKDICAGNFCIVCGINMGDNNPRQLCGKTYCYMDDYVSSDNDK
jgi:hypothetical protein